MRKYNLIWLLLLFTQCKNSDPNPAGKDADSIAAQKPAIEIADSACYQWTNTRDTVSLILSQGTGVRNGILIYDWAEKDGNNGNWKGEEADEILLGWYEFESEGISSVRQVAWKIKAEELWPAVGEIKVQNDTAMFDNVMQLKFDSSMALKKIPCNN